MAFSVDGTLIEAWASHRDFKPKDGSDGDGTNWQSRSARNETHASTTDPKAASTARPRARGKTLLYGPCHHGNRHGLAWRAWSRRPVAGRNAALPCDAESNAKPSAIVHAGAGQGL